MTTPTTASVQVQQTCTIESVAECNIKRNLLTGNIHPQSAFCTTSPDVLTVADNNADGTVVDYFCIVSLDQLMPMSTVLVYRGGSTINCICSVLEIPNSIVAEFTPFTCELYVKRCSVQVQLPSN